MKKSIYFALAVTSLALFACNSKHAESDQQSEEQVVQEIPAPAEEEVVVEEVVAEADSLAAEVTDSLAAEEPAAEEPAAEEQPAEEPAAEEPVDEEETIFSFVDDMPVPAFTKEEMPKLFVVNLNDIDPNADECRVVVTLVVEKDGRVSHPEVGRSTCDNEKLDAYALQHILNKCPRFKKPGRKYGEPVRTKYHIPVWFRKL